MLLATLLSLMLVQHPAPKVLAADPLNGTAMLAWRGGPLIFGKAPDGGLAARFARGSTWDPTTQPWIGDGSWSTYRVEVEVLPEKKWAGLDFHVQEDGRSGISLTMLDVPEDRLAFELSGLWELASAWKLWPVGQKLPPHTKGTWVRLRLDIGQDVANVYVGDSPDPVATFHDLPFPRGGLRLAAYGGSALFRNLRVLELPKDSVRAALPDPWAAFRGPDVLRAWSVCKHMENAPAEPPNDLLADPSAWRPAPVDGRGVVHLTSHFGAKNASGATFARTTLRGQTAGTRRLRLTYTDAFTLWCNGKKVFEGPPRQWFHPDRARHGYARLIPDQYEVALPLKAGDNELVVRTGTTEPFGWGFWVRLLEP